MSALDLILLALATFCAAHSISASNGPWRVFEWLRRHLPLAACFVCLSAWLAAVFYVLLQTVLFPIVYILAIAGLSVLAWRYTGANHV